MTDTVEHETRTRPGPTPGSTNGSPPVVLPVPPPPTAVDPAGPSAAPPVEPPAQPAPSAKWGLPLLVLILGMFMSILDTSIVNIAIPSIRQDFGVTAENAQWISTAYSLTEGAVVALSVYLGRRFGYKRVYVVSIGLFTLFSALCGLSWSLESMIAFRVLQAIPGGMIPVACISLIYRTVPPRSIGTATPHPAANVYKATTCTARARSATTSCQTARRTSTGLATGRRGPVSTLMSHRGW